MILQSIRATRPAQAEHPPQAPSYQATPGRSLSRLRCQVSERIVHVCCMDIIMTTINLGLRLDCSSSRAFSAWMRAGWRCFLAARGDDILRTLSSGGRRSRASRFCVSALPLAAGVTMRRKSKATRKTDRCEVRIVCFQL